MSLKVFFDTVRPKFPKGQLTAGQVEGMEFLLGELQVLPRAHQAYLLATVCIETAWTMQPVRETLATSDESAIARLDNAWAKGQLPWVKTPYWRKDAEGKAWFGRGYVQITHKANYAKAAQELNVPLLEDPGLALDPNVAADIMIRGSSEGWFTGKKLSDYLGNGKLDFVNARRVINGTDRAEEIAALAETFLDALDSLYQRPEPAPRDHEEVPYSPPVVTPEAPRTRYLEILGLVVAAITIIVTAIF